MPRAIGTFASRVRMPLTGRACLAMMVHMSRDTKVPPNWDPRATIRLRVDKFELMTRVVGATTMAQRSVLIGVDRKTIGRAINGVIGEVFMASTIAALRRHEPALRACGLTPSLDELFEVVTAETQEAAA